jgi:hypothetical protein
VGSWVDLLVLVGIGGLLYVALLVSLSDIFMHTVRSILGDAREQYLGR